MALGSLWLPVIASALAVWLLSSITHMALKYHKADYRGLPNEEGASAALRGTPVGHYFLPYCPDYSQLKDPAVQKKFQDGPIALITVMPSGSPTMGKPLTLWLLYCLLVSFVVAYIARHTLNPASAGLEVMRITGTGAFLAYGVGAIPSSIWAGLPWGNTFRTLFDALLYAAATGLVFRYLRPAG
jgi:hypothetical protein